MKVHKSRQKFNMCREAEPQLTRPLLTLSFPGRDGLAPRSYSQQQLCLAAPESLW